MLSIFGRTVFGVADLGMMLTSLRGSESFINVFTKRVSPSFCKDMGPGRT